MPLCSPYYLLERAFWFPIRYCEKAAGLCHVQGALKWIKAERGASITRGVISAFAFIDCHCQSCLGTPSGNEHSHRGLCVCVCAVWSSQECVRMFSPSQYLSLWVIKIYHQRCGICHPPRLSAFRAVLKWYVFLSGKKHSSQNLDLKKQTERDRDALFLTESV